MGNCSEACCSNRRKEASMVLTESMMRARQQGCDAESLRSAIKMAEDSGLDAIEARQQYAELMREERQTPEQLQEMLQWAMDTGDGVTLFSVIEEVESRHAVGRSPEDGIAKVAQVSDGSALLDTAVSAQQALLDDLYLAQQRLSDYQDDMRAWLQQLSRKNDRVDEQQLAAALERARRMGVAPEDLAPAQVRLRALEALRASRNSARKSQSKGEVVSASPAVAAAVPRPPEWVPTA